MESGIDPGQEYGQDYYSYDHGYIFELFMRISLQYLTNIREMLIFIIE